MFRVGYCKETALRRDYMEETPTTVAFLSVPIKKDQHRLGFWDCRTEGK